MLGIRCRRTPWSSFSSTLLGTGSVGRRLTLGLTPESIHTSRCCRISTRSRHSDPLLVLPPNHTRIEGPTPRLFSRRQQQQFSTQVASSPELHTHNISPVVSPIQRARTKKPTTAASTTTSAAPAPVVKIFHQWDPQMDATILTLHKEHYFDWRTIAKVIDRPHTTAYYRYLRNIQPALEQGWVPPQIKDQDRLKRLISEASRISEESRALTAQAAAQRRAVNSAPSKTPEKKVRGSSNKRRVWTADMDRRITELVEGGKTWPEIGEILSIPYSSCYTRWFSTLDPGLKNFWTEEAIERLKELVKQGASWKEIGHDLKIRPIACRTKFSLLGKVSTPLSTVATSIDIPSKRQMRQKISAGKTNTDARSPKVMTFSEKESRLIVQLVGKHGQDRWDLVLSDFQLQLLGSSAEKTSSSTLETGQDHTSLPNEPHSPGLTEAKAPRSTISRRRIQSITAALLEHQYIRLSRNKAIWTFDQETRLIQQVLRRGTDDGAWEEIAQHSGFHSPAECRSHWKQLDMPVRLNPTPWGRVEQTSFWSLWRQFGSDFKKISRFCLHRSEEDCRQFFEHATRNLPDPTLEPDEFSQKIQEIQDGLPFERQKHFFTKERSLRLQRAMKRAGMHIGKRNSSGYGGWEWVAQLVQPGMAVAPCVEHWNYLRKNMDVIYGPLEEGKTEIKPTETNCWSHEEIKLLDQGIRDLSSCWKEIQQRYLPWRTMPAIRQRWLTMSDRSLLVNEEEYYKIIGAGSSVDEIDFDALAKTMRGWKRSPCRRVFETSYKHLIAHTRWTPEEDHLLIRKVLEEHGRDWNAVAKHFQGVQTARATLFGHTPATSSLSPFYLEGLRVQKTAWQCRLRWSQLVEPLMSEGPALSVTQKSRALRLSKKLLQV
ncbi:hypothetical protein EMPS_05495 [Entomortierella parvispora]|uniref:Uncharacterized protein n=1 Tax=Entomortierella parvispora TaxID=205924 RepID=A0A9P3HAJ7_9FUNG|nr:hypothetical protein EMPS_05495 [Entomortierella parvispora]